MIRCRFVHDHRAGHPVTVLCKVAELSRATYYRWVDGLNRRDLSDAFLANEIIDIYRSSRKTYGSPRVWGQLRRNGTRVSVNRVARVMAEHGLVGGSQPKEVAQRSGHRTCG